VQPADEKVVVETDEVTTTETEVTQFSSPPTPTLIEMDTATEETCLDDCEQIKHQPVAADCHVEEISVEPCEQVEPQFSVTKLPKSAETAEAHAVEYEEQIEPQPSTAVPSSSPKAVYTYAIVSEPLPAEVTPDTVSEPKPSTLPAPANLKIAPTQIPICRASTRKSISLAPGSVDKNDATIMAELQSSVRSRQSRVMTEGSDVPKEAVSELGERTQDVNSGDRENVLREVRSWRKQREASVKECSHDAQARAATVARYRETLSNEQIMADLMSAAQSHALRASQTRFCDPREKRQSELLLAMRIGPV